MKESQRLPMWEPPTAVGAGRSILAFVEIVAGDVVHAVEELLEHEDVGYLSALGEDVAPQAGAAVLKLDKSEERFAALGAFCLIVGEVCEVLLKNVAFV